MKYPVFVSTIHDTEEQHITVRVDGTVHTRTAWLQQKSLEWNVQYHDQPPMTSTLFE